MVVSLPQYDIHIESGRRDTPLSQAGEIVQRVVGAHRYAVITDSNVGSLYADRLMTQLPPSSAVFTMQAGEFHKNRATWASLTDHLLDNTFGRDSAIIALGGGVVGDMAGFVAATFMRGIPVVQIPTTLLAMIDSSIGGKTGVDTPAGKNLVGAFHPPSAVIIDPAVLDTLPLEQLRTGLAEAIKHGVIADQAYFSFLEDVAPRLLASTTPRDPETLKVLARLIEWSVQIKAGVVAQDEREHGVRKILNFGHTIGHAIELLSDFSLAHGDAVAIGMALESAASEQAGVTDRGTTDRIINMLHHVGLPTIRPAGPSPDQILHTMLGDKKSRAGAIEYAVPVRLGVMANSDSGYGVRLDETIVRSVLTPTAATGGISTDVSTQPIAG